MAHDTLHFKELMPDFIHQAALSPAMLRLQDVGMNCGCEYTQFERFKGLARYSRWDHSVGVARIVWDHTHDCAQALAGLFHDIATPCFSHVVDFVHGDYLTQESTEAGTTSFIDNSPEIQTLLTQLGLVTADVSDYHIYPIADNNTPRLSADRLEYSLGNLLNFGFSTASDVQKFYNDLTVSSNEDGDDELVFQTATIARGFALGALQCGNVYVSAEDRYAMQMLAELLQDALADSVITWHDLYGTEANVIDKLSNNEQYATRWKRYCAMSVLQLSDAPDARAGWRKIVAKKRYIDPLVLDRGRVSALFPDFQQLLTEFINAPQDQWILAYNQQ